MKSGGPLKRKKGLAKRSRRAISYADELNALTPTLAARSGGICEVCGFRPPTQRHHRLRRSQGGLNTLENLLHVCDACHDHIHQHPAESYAKDLLRKRANLVERGPYQV